MTGQQSRFLNIDICACPDLTAPKKGNQTHPLLTITRTPDTGLVIEVVSGTRVQIEIQAWTWPVLEFIREMMAIVRTIACIPVANFPLGKASRALSLCLRENILNVI